jgi:hypothetical protein
MAQEIIDGSGGGHRAQVDSDKRLHVNSVSRTQLEQAVLLGVAYNVSSGSMTLTNTSESAIAYLKYNGDEPLVIKEILVILGDSDGTGNGLIKLIKNPTAGTIVSNALAVSAVINRDFGSPNVLDADIYKGAEGYTLTGGVNFAITSRNQTAQVVSFDAAPIELRKGNSIGVTYTPPTGNTSQSIVVAGTVFIETATVSGDLDL